MLLSANGMDVSSALSTATSLFGWVVDCITSNPVMTATFVVSTLIPAGVMVFRNVKHTV